MKTNLRL